MLEPLFNKSYRLEGVQLYQKETPTQVFFCEYCEIFKSTYFEEHLRTVASEKKEPPRTITRKNEFKREQSSVQFVNDRTPIL